jgi:hypothetical protein
MGVRAQYQGSCDAVLAAGDVIIPDSGGSLPHALNAGRLAIRLLAAAAARCAFAGAHCVGLRCGLLLLSPAGPGAAALASPPLLLTALGEAAAVAVLSSASSGGRYTPTASSEWVS